MNKDKLLNVARRMRANFPRNTIKVIVVDSTKTLDSGSVVFRVMLDPSGFRTNRVQVSWSRNRGAAQAQCDKYNEWLKEAGLCIEKRHCPDDEAMLLAALGPPDNDE